MDKYTLMKEGVLAGELLACITGFIYWKKIRHSYWKWFPFYLLAIVLTENTAKFLGDGENYKEIKMLLYQVWCIPLQFFFFFWLFYKYFKANKDKVQSKIPLIGAGIYILGWLCEFFFFKGTSTWFFSFSYMIGNVILSVLLLAFFSRFINSDRILGYRSDMMFWVCIGAMIFYFGSLPYYGLFNSISLTKLGNIYWFFQMSFSISMYLFFIITFIWGKPKT